MKSNRSKNNKEGDKMFLKTDYPILESVLDWYFEINKIERPSNRTDINELAKKMDFEIIDAFIEPKNNVKVEGVLLVDEVKNQIAKFSGPRGIALNYFNNPEDNRFIIAHELSHYMFEKFLADNAPLVLTEQRLEHIVGHKRDDFEQAIDYMAAAILMPLEQFRNQFKFAEEKQQPMQDFVKEMSIYYRMPDKAIEKRIKELSDISELESMNQ